VSATVHNIGEARRPRPAATIDWSEPFITKQQLANHLGFSVSWVERRVKEGMPSHKVGSRLRFQRSQAIAWLIAQGEQHGNS